MEPATRRACATICGRLALAGLALLSPLATLAQERFTTPSAYAFGQYPFRVAAADLDGDAARDLVLVDPHSSRVAIFYGAGDGTFESSVELTPAFSPDSIQLADVDGDGALDILVASSRGVISVFTHQEGRTFTRIRNTAIRIVDFGFAAADFNGDGKADLFAVVDGGARLLFGRGDGTFEPQPVLADRLLIWSAAVADLDGDGSLDVVAADGNSPGAHVFVGDGRGGLGQEIVLTGPAFARVDAADLNGDDAPDVVGRAVEGLFVYPNLGNGVFGDAVFSSDAAGSLAYDIALADIDGDGRADLVEADYNRSVVSIYREVGGGKLRRTGQIPLPGRPEGLVVADLNGGGRPDIAVTVPDVASVLVSLNGAPDVTETRFVTRGDAVKKLVLSGKNSDHDIRVYVGDMTQPWPAVRVLRSRIELGDGAAIEAAFPRGMPVRVRLVNVDGEQSAYWITR